MKTQKTYHLVLHLIPSQIPVQTWEIGHKFLSFFDHLANKLILVQIPSPVSIPPHIQSQFSKSGSCDSNSDPKSDPVSVSAR